MGRHNLRRSHGTGQGHQAQLPGPMDHVHIDIRRDDVLCTGRCRQLHQLCRSDRSGTHHHLSRIGLTDSPDGPCRRLERCGILLIKGNLHQPNAAFIQGLCYLHALFSTHAAHNGDDLFLQNLRNDLFAHNAPPFS